MRIAAFLALAVFAFQDGTQIPRDTLPAELPATIPLGLPESLAEVLRAPAAEVALGRRLFFDPILSIDKTVACASCHDPARGMADERALSNGVNGARTLRNAPAIVNRALGASFMWDGRVATLEEQVLQPIENELEMGLAVDEAVARLDADAAYRAEFEAAFGARPSRDTLARSLASFVRRLLIGDSPLDRFRTGDIGALSQEARSGLWLYESRGGCWRCHSGPNFSDEKFHTTGIGAVEGKPEPGRFAITGKAEDLGRFKTPTLRGVAESGPYMHDGSLATLEEVVEFYRQGGRSAANLDSKLRPIELSDDDARHLVAFLRALSPERK
jgi:cytochrome c peroxidase